MSATLPVVNLMQLASRQIVPNVMLGLALQRNGRLRSHVVLHSSDRRESGEPAEQLFRLLGAASEEGEEPTVACEMVEVDETASSVFHAARDLIEASGPNERWILHTTLGNKLMSLGLQLLATHPAVHSVVYKDIRGPWRQIRVDAYGVPDDPPLSKSDPLGRLLAESPVMLDTLPLDALLSAQFARDEAIDRWPAQEIVGRPALAGWLQRAVRKGGGFADGPPGGGVTRNWNGDGGAFECFLANLLSQSGVRHVLWNVEGVNASGGKLAEFDVIGCHGNQLVFYDVKLERPQSAGKTEQLRAAKATSSQFGGLSASCVVVRPNWPPSKPVVDFAEATAVTLIHRGNVGNLRRLVLAPFGAGLTWDRLDGVDALLRDLAGSRGPVLFWHRPL